MSHFVSSPFAFLRTRVLLLACAFVVGFPCASAVAADGDFLPGSVGPKDPTKRPSVREPEDPETLYNRGLRQLRRGYYDEAIISFEKVKNHFPFNQYSVLCELRVADALFEKDSYLESIDAYRQFTRLHPRHSEIDYAIYRMARAEFKVASSVPQRDQTSTERGLKKLRGFEKRFPESEYIEEVVRIRSKARVRLAKRVLQVGNFYWKTREWKAAERRYGMVWDDYSDTSVIYKARYRQGLCLHELDRGAEARAVLSDLAGRAESGRWGERAQRFLDRRGVPVPEAVPAVTSPSEDAPAAEDATESELEEPESESGPESAPPESDQEKLSTGN